MAAAIVVALGGAAWAQDRRWSDGVLTVPFERGGWRQNAQLGEGELLRLDRMGLRPGRPATCTLTGQAREWSRSQGDADEMVEVAAGWHAQELSARLMERAPREIGGARGVYTRMRAGRQEHSFLDLNLVRGAVMHAYTFSCASSEAGGEDEAEAIEALIEAIDAAAP